MQDIIKFLEDQLINRNAELKRVQHDMLNIEKCIKILKNDTTEITVEPTILNETLLEYPDYPHKATLIEKYRYLEDKELRFWHRTEFDELIKKIEGKKASKAFKNISNVLAQLVKENRLIRVKYANKHLLTFYTTRKEWVETLPDGTFNMLEDHKPYLNAEFNNEKIDELPVEWHGIETNK